MIRRGLLRFLVIFGLLVATQVFFVPSSRAEPTEYCNGTNLDRFILSNDQKTLTHTCGNNFIEVTFDTKSKISGDKLAVKGVSVSVNSFNNSSNTPDRKYIMYELKLLSTSKKYFLAQGEGETQTRGGLWTSDPAFDDSFKAERSNYSFFQVNQSLLNSEPHIAGAQYLSYLFSKSWPIVDKNGGASLGGVAGCFHNFEDYYPNATAGDPNDEFKYFQPNSRIFSEPAVGDNVRLTVTGSTATITIERSPRGRTDLNRPSITFTYRYYMMFADTSYLRAITQPVRNANYFYFLPDQTSKHCNLALRISDGKTLSQVHPDSDTPQGAVLAINLDKIKQVGGAVFELGQYTSFTLNEDDWNKFIKKLYNVDPATDSFTSSDKLIQQRGKADELSGIRLFSGDNPLASTGGSSTCPPELNKLPIGLGAALCGVADLVMGVAVSFANISFRLLLQSTTLQ